MPVQRLRLITTHLHCIYVVLRSRQQAAGWPGSRLPPATPAFNLEDTWIINQFAGREANAIGPVRGHLGFVHEDAVAVM